MYYFFTKDSDGDETYGPQYFVMSDSYKNAENSVTTSDDWMEGDYNIAEMGVREYEINQVISAYNG